MNDYTDRPDWAGYSLEDSWVESISVSVRSVRITMEAVLARVHPLWTPPEAGRQHTTAYAELVFVDVDSTVWTNQRASWSTDAAGKIDLGNLDSFKFDGDKYFLEGSWGELEIDAGTAAINLLSPDPAP